MDEESHDDDYLICKDLKQFIWKLLVKLTSHCYAKQYDRYFQRSTYLLN